MTFITPTSVSTTSAELAFGGVPAGSLLIEVQYSFRHDFSWCVSPVIRSASLATMTLGGLNQAARYFMRARAVSTSGDEEDWGPIVGIATGTGTLRSLSPANIMIEPALIIPPEPVLEWAADNEDAGYPARALGRDDPNSSWWADISGTAAFEARMSGAPIDTIAILETCASEAAQVKVKAGFNTADIRSGSPSYSTGFLPFRASANLPGRKGYHCLVRLPSPQMFPYWRVEISGAMPGSLFVATYAVFGLARSTKNFAVDSKSETLLDMGSVERDRSGNVARTSGYRGRAVDFEIVNMTEAQYEAAFEQVRWLVGTTEPALVIPNSKPGPFLHDRILYGQLSAGRATNTVSPRFSSQFSVQSLI